MGIQKKVTYTIVDDFDQTVMEVEEVPTPIKVVYQDQGYDLYMSDANAKKFDTYLQKILKNADKFTPGKVAGSGTGGTGSKSEAQVKVEESGDTIKDVKNWAVPLNRFKTAKGDNITDSAPRLNEAVWKAYLEEVVEKR